MRSTYDSTYDAMCSTFAGAIRFGSGSVPSGVSTQSTMGIHSNRHIWDTSNTQRRRTTHFVVLQYVGQRLLLGPCD